MIDIGKDLFRGFVDAWNRGDVDSYGDYMTENVIEYNPLPGEAAQGLEALRQRSALLRGAFPDLNSELHLVIAEGDLVSGLQTMRGTHKGDFMGIPATGKSFQVTRIDIARVAGDKMVEHWGLVDQGALMGQLGLMPPPPGVPADWAPPPTSPVMSGAEPGDPAGQRVLLREILDAIAAGDLDRVLATIHPDAIDHSGLPGQGPGRDGFRFRFEQLFAGLTDARFETLVSVCEGPFASNAFSFSATHTGTVMGMPATGKSFRVAAVDFVGFRDGNFYEVYGLIDFPAMLGQLGLLPAP
jgi:predicted ester cyclase